MKTTSISRLVAAGAAGVAGFLLAMLFFGPLKDRTQRLLFNSFKDRSYRQHQQETPDFGVNENGKKIEDHLRLLREKMIGSNLPSPETIANMSKETETIVSHSFLDNTDIVCQSKLRMGRIDDGGWEVCDDYAWRPIPPCIVYSFGIGDFSFDDDIGKLYGCQVYSFDPSMKEYPVMYKRSAKVTFYPYGLDGRYVKKNDIKWTMYSFSGFKSMLNHNDKIIDVVKMDIEGSEWASLRTMLDERQLSNVRQLLVEFHMWGFNTTRLQVLADLEKTGFRKFYVHKNPACWTSLPVFPVGRTECYEVHYVNTRFVRETPSSAPSGSGLMESWTAV